MKLRNELETYPLIEDDSKLQQKQEHEPMDQEKDLNIKPLLIRLKEAENECREIEINNESTEELK